ncbi:MAG: sigma-54-dependent Fis family transcriptional regulator [Gemmatimonadaceae bacterium]|nr:sigma-54-dependent Fis family transcriptional regulator [Gemmatimonadaceae bacterium]
MKALITLTDVEPAVRLNALLEATGITTELVSPLDDIRGTLERFEPDVVVITGALLDTGNVQVVREELWAGVPVVGLADVDEPGMRERLRGIGYADVLVKPVLPDDVAPVVRRLLERRRLSQETGLSGDTEALREVLVKIEQIAPVSSTVLIEGESGTGKELVARGIHRLGPRRNKPFIGVNVGALAETLLESELFGHEKGAFTGAAERRLGRFELADGGTLFLDEIGDIPPSTQVKLLRVLEEREVTRVGGVQSIPVNVRVIAATNRPLRELVEDGGFRSDLYYRLNVLSMYLPPLRERKSDIPVLVRRFIAEFSRRHDKAFHGISADAMEMLARYSWPGNVRELRNLVESMVVLSPGHEIGVDDIPPQIREGLTRMLPVRLPMVSSARPLAGEASPMLGSAELEFILRNLVELKVQVEDLRRRLDQAPMMSPTEALVAGGAVEPKSARLPNTVEVVPGMTMSQIERAVIEATLRETRGNRRRAAELLGIGERTLYRKIREIEGGGAIVEDALS